jgi:hypothetical protein
VGIQTLALVLICAVLLCSALAVNGRYIRHNLRSGLGQSLTEYYSRDPEWGNYLRAMNWIADYSVQPAVVMCRKADLLYILTGHQALEYPYSADGLRLMDFARDNRVAYIIEDAFTWTQTTPQYLSPALDGWLTVQPGSLTLAFETDAPRTRVWCVERNH